MQNADMILQTENPSGAPSQSMYWISYLANHFTIPAYRKLGDALGITRHEGLILLSLDTLQNGLTAGEIAELSGRPKNSISRAVSSLEKRQLIRRRSATSDRRQQPMTLTAEGRGVAKKISAHFRHRSDAAMNALTQNEQEQLGRLLAKLVSASSSWMHDDD